MQKLGSVLTGKWKYSVYKASDYNEVEGTTSSGGMETSDNRNGSSLCNSGTYTDFQSFEVVKSTNSEKSLTTPTKVKLTGESQTCIGITDPSSSISHASECPEDALQLNLDSGLIPNISIAASDSDSIIQPFLPSDFTPIKKTLKKHVNPITSTPVFVDSLEVTGEISRKTRRKRTIVNYSLENDDDNEILIKKKLPKNIQSKVKCITSHSDEITVKTELTECLANISSSSNLGTNIKVRKRGRPKRETIMEFDSSGQIEIVRLSDPGDTVTCAVCNKELNNSEWVSHKLRAHNNLSWRIGETPLDLDDQQFVMRTLNALYKRKLPLHCDMCGQIKKSVNGLLSHKALCSKSLEEVAAARIKCDLCGRTVLPVSMNAHIKLCKGYRTTQPIKKRETDKSFPLIIDKCKRRAAAKADTIIQNLKEGEVDNSAYLQTWFKNKDFWLSPELLTRIRNDIYKYGTEKCCVFECNFESPHAVTFAQHYQSCVINFKEELYVCKFCVTIGHSEETILAHVRKSHRIKNANDGNLEILEIDINEEEEAEEQPFVHANAVRLTVSSIKFLVQNRYCTASTNVLYPVAYDWTLEFCNNHFSTLNLYSNWKMLLEDWSVLDSRLIYKYLPKLKMSANISKICSGKFVNAVELDHTWKKFKLFESEVWDNGTATMFCGGQIFAMAWLPTPFNEKAVDQILAICASSCSMDKLFTMEEIYYEPDLIQFWNFGPLANDVAISTAPKLGFCIAHDYGPVRILEWCPSGCYDCETDQEHLRRMGLLAVGCSNSQIHIYSVSHLELNSAKIFKPKPVIKLVMEFELVVPAYGVEAHVTKISWTKASGHQFIAAGYSNGMVALFNLQTMPLLLMQLDSDNVPILMPYRLFKAHLHSVTALQLFHLTNGGRWLMTGSSDRTIRYWDLDNVVTPLTSITKSTVTDGVWISHWLSSIHLFDDCCGTTPTTSIIYQPRNFVSEHASTMYSNCHSWSISGSEWLNGFAQGNIMGELQGFFPHQLFAGMDNDKSKNKKKIMLSYISLVEKDLDVQERIAASAKQNIKPKPNISSKSLDDLEEMNNVSNLFKAELLNYKDAAEKYGVVFCDIKIKALKDSHENMTNYTRSNSTKFCNPQPNIYPMQSLNKVAFNPNHSSFLYLAVAYQIGIVRVLRLNFLTK